MQKMMNDNDSFRKIACRDEKPRGGNGNAGIKNFSLKEDGG